MVHARNQMLMVAQSSDISTLLFTNAKHLKYCVVLKSILVCISISLEIFNKAICHMLYKFIGAQAAFYYLQHCAAFYNVTPIVRLKMYILVSCHSSCQFKSVKACVYVTCELQKLVHVVEYHSKCCELKNVYYIFQFRHHSELDLQMVLIFMVSQHTLSVGYCVCGSCFLQIVKLIFCRLLLV